MAANGAGNGRREDELHDFHNEVADRILETYFTINRGIRGAKLWEAINGERIERQYKRDQDSEIRAGEGGNLSVESDHLQQAIGRAPVLEQGKNRKRNRG